MNPRNKIILLVLATLATGFLLGWAVFGGKSANEAAHEHDLSAAEEAGTTWTCSMHPQIRAGEPGKCPLCGMDLIPLESEESSADPAALRMTPAAVKLANIQTSLVEAQSPVRELRLNGKIRVDERRIYSQVSHLPGRIEALRVNFTGETVKKGQELALIYSPDLVTAQEELLEAREISERQPALFLAAKEKLKNWKLTEAQIQALLDSGKPQAHFPILADVDGIVTGKKVSLGDYVMRGVSLYEISDLSRVWVLLDVYERDISWVKVGSRVEYTLQAIPGQTFTGRVSFIDPFIDPQTRVATARVEVGNPGLHFKPEMFVSARIQTSLPPSATGLVIPQSAVLWTGERSVVYVKTGSAGKFEFTLREVLLGSSLGNAYVVAEGLSSGEEIVTHGAFTVDAAAQLAGKPSMMNPVEALPAAGHDHGAMKTAVAAPDISDQSPAAVDPAFQRQLGRVVDAYLELSDALVASDAKTAQTKAKSAQQALKSTQMKLLRGLAHEQWMALLPTLNASLARIAQANDLEEQRSAFMQLGEAMYSSIRQLGVEGPVLYYQYCPMAVGDQGAYWLSREKEIRNPYFGDSMLRCGENKETLGE